MLPLPTNQKVLKFLCIWPLDVGEDKWKKIVYIIFAAYEMGVDLCALISDCVFFLKYISIDLEESLYALFQVFASAGMTYVFIVALLQRREITAFLNTLATIYDAHANEETIQYLEQARNKSEQVWDYYLKFGMGGFIVQTIGITVTCVSFCLMTGKGFDPKYLYRVYRLSLPWSQDTPIGYAATIGFSLLYGEGYLLVNGTFLLLFVSICWNHEAFYYRFEHSVHRLNHSKHNRSLKQGLCEIINFHNSVKEWFMETSKVYSIFILVQLICSMVFLACCMFQVDLQMKHLDFSFVLLLTGIAVAVGNLYVYCYYGKVATVSYERMGDCLFESNWIDHPTYLQKYFIIMIGNTHRPLYYHGFGIAVLNLETYTKMIKTCFTFYMSIKTLTTR